MLSVINKIVALGLAGFLLAGCSTVEKSVTGANESVDTAKACAALEKVFLNSEDGFKAIRLKPRFHNKITLWKSSYQVIEGSCEIWQWSNRYSYVCSRVLPDELTAQQVYNRAREHISQCLTGAEHAWSVQAGSLSDKKGEKTDYLLNGQVRGSLQRVRTGGLFSSDWTVYLLIDSPKLNIPSSRQPG